MSPLPLTVSVSSLEELEVICDALMYFRNNKVEVERRSTAEAVHKRLLTTLRENEDSR